MMELFLCELADSIRKVQRIGEILELERPAKMMLVTPAAFNRATLVAACSWMVAGLSS